MFKTFYIGLSIGRVSDLSYQRKFWAWAALAIGGAAIGGLFIGRIVPKSGGVENPAFVLPLFLAVAGLLMVVVWFWWQRTDDVQRQGQLVSWYWGGNFGAIVMLLSMIVLTGRHSDISLGATYLFGAQFVGMLVVWLGWKFHGRGTPE